MKPLQEIEAGLVGAPARDAVEFLRQMKWYRALFAEAQRRVAADVYETTHARGTIMAASGETVHSWFGVVEGLVKAQAVQASGKVVAFTAFPAGSWFGEGSVLRREPRRYDAVAIRPSRIVHVPAATFRWLLDVSLEFNHYVIDQLNERLSQNISLIEIHRLIDPETRLASVICNLFNQVLYPNRGAFVPISQEEFGDLANLSRQRTNSAIQNLQKAGLITVTYGGIVVEDLEGLTNFVHVRGARPAESQPSALH